MPDATAIHDLPALTWLGSKAYASDIETSWNHRLAVREFPYVDGDAHEKMGRASLSVTATLHWLNTIERGLFPGRWRNFRGLLLRGESGTLSHPDIGNFHARVDSVGYTITAKTTAGVSVRVKWVESIRSADEPTKIVVGSSDSLASAQSVDALMAEMGLEYPDGMPGDSTFEAAVSGLASMGAEFTHQLASAVNQITGLADQVFQSIKLIGNANLYISPSLRDPIVSHPGRHALEFGLNSLRMQLKSMLETAQKAGGETKLHVVTADQPLASLSIALGTDISSLIRLNPGIVKSPIVSKGTKLTYRPLEL